MNKKKAFIPLSLLPLAGSSPKVISSITKGCNVDKAFKTRLSATKVAAFLSGPFREIERMKYKKRLQRVQLPESPLFILGHWRSGTTLLHNIISHDPQYGFVTTYQSVFPSVTLSGKWLFRNFMKLAMPDKRPADNVKLSASFPQEEEFALSNLHGMSFYNFWYFPLNTQTYFHDYLLLDGLNTEQIAQWKSTYQDLVKTAMLNTKSNNIVLKNPPSTGRIKTILEVFPNAKFIHIYRNPVIVFLSTMRFFKKTMPALQLQHISKEEFIENIFSVYLKLMDRYEQVKSLIPEGNLIEIKFETFEKNPLENLKQIYEGLNLNGFETAAPHFRNYLETQKKFKKNKNKISQKLLNEILDKWGHYMHKYEYKTPENILISNN